MKFSTCISLLLIAISINTLTSCKKGETNEPDLSIKLKDTTKTIVIDSLKVGLIAYYPFNNSGVDESGNGNHGFIYNITSATDRNGKINSAYHFDGISSFVQVKDNQTLRVNSTDFSINAWVKLDVFNSTFSSAIFSKRNSGGNFGYYLGVNGTGGASAIGSIGFGPGGGAPGLTSTGLIATNTWTMVTTVYNLSKQQVTIYKNGVFDTSSALNVTSPSANQIADIYIGSDNPGTGASYFFKGSIDDVRLYNRALTVKEMQKLFVLTY